MSASYHSLQRELKARRAAAALCQHRANGQSYHAKFDGKEYPIEGDPGHTMVTLKRVDANTVIETDYRQGKVTDEVRLAASKDGKTIDLTDKDAIHGQTTTITLDKQP